MDVNIEPQPSRHIVRLTLTPKEAEGILEDFDKSKEPGPQTKTLINALMAVREDRRETG